MSIIVDTPGFDNTKRSDAEVLKSVAVFLEELCVKIQASGHLLEYADKEVFRYSARRKLTGIVYIHRTSDSGAVSRACIDTGCQLMPVANPFLRALSLLSCKIQPPSKWKVWRVKLLLPIWPRLHNGFRGI